MKLFIRCAMILIASTAVIQAADVGSPSFIEKAGTHQLTPKMTLTIAADAAGGLRYTLVRKIGTSGTETEKGKVTAPFIFYWDDSAQVLWEATEKTVTSRSANRLESYDRKNPKALAKAPEAFRKEVARVFKSP
jgi:hypothetical protein